MSELKFFSESAIRNLELCITSSVRNLSPDEALNRLRDARSDLFEIYWRLSGKVVEAEAELKKLKP